MPFMRRPPSVPVTEFFEKRSVPATTAEPETRTVPLYVKGGPESTSVNFPDTRTPGAMLNA